MQPSTESQTQESPMSTAVDLPTSDPYAKEYSLAPRVECIDYSDSTECGRYTCCGQPLVDGFSKHTLLSQNDPVQVAMWDDIPGEKVLCWLATPYSFPVDTSFQLLKDAIAAILPIDSRFRLSPPAPSPLTKGARPVAFLVWNISKDESNLLSSREIWSTSSPRDLAFFAEDYDSSPSPFVYTATGFTDKDRFGTDEIDTLFRESIRWHPTVIAFVARFYDALPDASHASPDYLLSMSRVELMTIKNYDTGEDVDYWNLSMETPTDKPALHAAWRKLIASIPLISLEHGTARAVDKAFLCTICLATSHPSEYCPCLNLRDWKGPWPSSSLAKVELPEDRDGRCIAGSGEPLLCNRNDEEKQGDD